MRRTSAAEQASRAGELDAPAVAVSLCRCVAPCRHHFWAGLSARACGWRLNASATSGGFDLESNTWSQVAAEGELPALRYGSAGGIFDFGGDALYLSDGFADTGRFDDTWAFGLGSDTWRNVTPAGPVPLKRCLPLTGIPREPIDILANVNCDVAGVEARIVHE